MTSENKKTLLVLCSIIEKLEEKRDNETITFEEAVTLNRLIQQADYILSL
jgi:hypothetical protein